MRHLSCPVIGACGLLGRKWGVALISELHFEKKFGFNHLQRSLKNISPRVLSELLKELERSKLVLKIVVKNRNQASSVYSLTEKGEELQHIIGALKHWGIKWDGLGAECLEKKCSECEKFFGEKGLGP